MESASYGKYCILQVVLRPSQASQHVNSHEVGAHEKAINVRALRFFQDRIVQRLRLYKTVRIPRLSQQEITRCIIFETKASLVYWGLCLHAATRAVCSTSLACVQLVWLTCGLRFVIVV